MFGLLEIMFFSKKIFSSKNYLPIYNITDNKVKLNYVLLKKGDSFSYFIAPNFIYFFIYKNSLYLCLKNKSLWWGYLNKYKEVYFNLHVVYSLSLEITGVGYKVFLLDNCICVSVGLSHLIKIKLPNSILYKIVDRLLILEYSNKYILGNIYHILRNTKSIDKYKGKGIKKIYDNINLKIIKSKIMRGR